jgi:hypothetical protein
MMFLRVGCLAGHVFTRVYTWRLEVREWEPRPLPSLSYEASKATL